MKPDPEGAIEIFTEALQLPAGERSAFLDRVCAENESLRRKIEALLRSNERAGSFLEEPPTASISEKRENLPVGEKPGDQIGRYTLLEQIGEGGCGIVFLAEQQEPIRRRVALKVVKPGMDSKSVIARFEAERQALALMDHSNIAQVFDAGATPSGRPYFVMEWVNGVKLTEYCDQHFLTTIARLELFAQICDAIQHAHQKGVIHRDIKPSNILVTTGDNGKPLPKVIDFGIAKAVAGQQLTDKTIFTAFEMLVGTPAYMSPEQVTLSSAEIDTRSDIYSLGVLLYELLTGATPFDTRELLKAGLDEVRRVIRDEEPIRPSTRLNTMAAADVDTVSRLRGAEPPKLISEMRGDLDWIVMKALEKDRARRYPTANGLATEIQRYLSGEEVLARPPSNLYRFQKLFYRHKVAFLTCGIVLLTLLAALSVTIWSLEKERLERSAADHARYEATEQQKIAEANKQDALTEAAESQATAQFMVDMLKSVDPTRVTGDVSAVFDEMLDKTTERVEKQLTNRPIAQADLRVALGSVYGSLGLRNKEKTLIDKALAAYAQSHDTDQKTALAHAELSEMYAQENKMSRSEEEARKALDLFKGQEGIDVALLEVRLAHATLTKQRPAEAEAILRKALAMGQRFAGEQDGRWLEANMLLAIALANQGQLTNAELALRHCVSIAQANYGTNNLRTVDHISYLAVMLAREGDLGQADKLCHQCVATVRKLVPSDHPALEDKLVNLGNVLHMEGKNAEATDVYREALQIRRKYLGDQDEQIMQTATILLKILAADNDEARFTNLSKEIPELWFVKSEDFAEHGQWAEAKAAAGKFLEMHPSNPNAYHLMVPLLAQMGDVAGYAALCEKACERFAGAKDTKTADRMAKDCLILARPGADLKVPSDLAEIAVTQGRNDSASLPYFQCCKALAELRTGHYEEAVNWAQLASKGMNPHCQAEAAAIMAMSQFKLSQKDKAQSALADCNKIIEEKLKKLEKGDLGGDWRDWIIAHALQSEAKNLIDGEPLSPEPPGNLPR